ncbi:DNA polymerase III subunit delta [Effusibacillus dendaii]|uniref:DNA polymerase III subunit delta n=1 Tax=Effusibacillus dendaii TaxID=2743772 RepID=A0A7I8DEL2_9BACL|nr:DNA polymerase III subunit delta [Effusibacillus dendaii]BCJ88593.1 hypothetical protein skT53_35780 [Effusibacillus dendaii]
MSYSQLVQEIEKGIIHPVYLLYGTETLLMKEVLEALEQAVAADDPLGTQRFHCDEVPIQTAVREAETLPFLSEKRLVVAQNATVFTSAKSSLEHDTDALLHYLENPSPTSVFVCTVTAEKLDERKKIFKAAQKNGKVAAFLPLKEQELKAWMAQAARRKKVTITSQAVDRLLFMCGSNLTFLDTELEKLSHYAGENNTIDEDMVNTLASRTLEQDIFVFVDEVVRLRTEQALRMMSDLLKNKQSPVYLLFMIARQIRIMLQVKIQTVRGLSVQQVAGQIGAHPYACKIAAEQARRFSRQDLERFLMELGDIDYQIKTGRIRDRHALEMFLLTMQGKIGTAG